MLISLVIDFLFIKTSERVPSPIELWFYDEYIVVYRLKRYYSKKVSRKEFNKFYYTDIQRCTYNNLTKRFNIIGKVDATWYDYNRDGSIPSEPTYHRAVDGGICYFYMCENESINIVEEIERNSTIKVQIEQ